MRCVSKGGIKYKINPLFADDGVRCFFSVVDYAAAESKSARLSIRIFSDAVF